MNTEGIKYAGSKLKLIPHILKLVRKVDAKTILDGFSGTTRVSQVLSKLNYTVICNDIAVWSEVFGTCYLLCYKRRERYQPLIDYLNSIVPTDGWFTENYGGYVNEGSSIQQDGRKRPWQIHNTRKLDAIRQEIEKLRLNDIDKSIVLTSLILALDKVDNTLGHFVSYLKVWSSRSYDKLVLKVPNILVSSKRHRVFRSDIFDLIPRISADLAYLDPPYGSNNDKMPSSRIRYASYYHVWKSVCLFDKPDLYGKASRRKDTSDKTAISIFEEFKCNSNGRLIAIEAIEKLIKEIKVQWIILSYSSKGRVTIKELYEVIESNTRILTTIKLDYKKNVMAGMKWTNKWIEGSEQRNYEFLFLLEK